ncbi:MAG: PQQ-dependent sugar dehydrogenase [Flavobacteriales bacterium]|nr:PQQ-dependent sugar dehydrogenase [Flavobacteriales bacterium]
MKPVINMKHLLIVIISVLTFGLSSTNSIAQDTWDIEGTILTEYDLVTGIQLPWEILWGPDDMIWATTRPGDVFRINPETGGYTNVLNLTVYGNGGSEPGLLGMAMHPEWENTPKVY